jgi:dihydropteroate synthase
VLLALSRKDFVGALTHRRPADRLGGTLGAVAFLAGLPGLILRTHDVAATRDLLTVLDALEGRIDVAEDLELPVELRRQPPPTA